MMPGFWVSSHRRSILAARLGQQGCHPTTICTGINMRKITKDGEEDVTHQLTSFTRRASQFCKQNQVPIHSSARDRSPLEKCDLQGIVCALLLNKSRLVKRQMLFLNSCLERRKTCYYFVKISHLGSLSPLSLYGL